MKKGAESRISAPSFMAPELATFSEQEYLGKLLQRNELRERATSGAKASGAKASGAKTSGAKTSGAKTSGAKTSGAKTSGAKT